ncbi:aminopeptidase-like protein, partial [Neoconidiobolus thromboides FSU 785]
MDLYYKLFGQPYPISKLDLIAIPDFNIGAMENWGLVTFRTVCLLYEEGISSFDRCQKIANIVAHELAHQWFGNLVALEWWSQLWLKEGFATYIASYAVDKLFPEWDAWTDFVMDDYQRALKLDSLKSSHPIQVPVNDPKQIGQIFDAISYSKGASILRMLFSYLGEDKFFEGIRVYL